MSKTKSSEIDHYWQRRGPYGVVVRAALRTLQFTFAIIVAALYGVDLAHATKTDSHAPSEWIYAELVAAASAITCIIHCSVMVTHVAWSAGDGVLCVLWVAQVGTFGTIYNSDISVYYANVTLSIARMRAAFWIDLINMLLWLLTTILGISRCIQTRKVTRRTGQLDDSQNTPPPQETGTLLLTSEEIEKDVNLEYFPPEKSSEKQLYTSEKQSSMAEKQLDVVKV
ncbi:hypothetical protein N7462_011614 [Penicillium macrosclerotiorum]|uniref:uncharacterized protein n=1 Tax=Penicillium macrosclerotiorum TaxID=303699 RepID=UPI0025496EC9|nr:uncharacterized protein N7462_011614 [Penicillium macrosclerotiorum]KAJ5662688.1 hypothetical protein N7462_011614 [Penicillium macrosclerotiorum]